jgi:DNA (cytosine-5)-methyltransferase 1
MHREGCTARGGQLGIFGTAPPEACRGCYFERRILPDLSERFEHVGWWLLDAASFGVPQHRRRVILWAGPAPVVEPVPTHGPGRALPWVSMGEALGIDGNITLHDGTRTHAPHASGGPPAPDYDATGKPARTIRAGRAPGMTVGSGMKGSKWGIGRPAPTLRDGNGTAGLYLRQPSPAVTTTEVKGTRASEASGGTFNGGPDRASDALWLATGRRRLTVEECAILQDFPPDHPWQGNSQARYRQVGNAVPPTLARVVGEAVMRAAGTV